MITKICYGCEDRKVGCHGTCLKYKEWKKEWEERKKMIIRGDRKHKDYFYHK